MFKSNKRKKLERKSDDLDELTSKIIEMEKWCAECSPEIAFAMRYLLDSGRGIYCFRYSLVEGEFTRDAYKEANND